MKLKFAFFYISILFFVTVAKAQKYGSSGGVVVEKEWNGISFSSERTLAENVTLASNFEKTAEMLNELETAIFTKDFMATVFVTVDESFSKLTEEELKAFMADKQSVKAFFEYHIIPGRLDAHALKKAIEKNGGVAKLKTLQGETLGIKMVDEQLTLFDSQNNSATILASDFYHKNGFFHIVEGLIYPAQH